MARVQRVRQAASLLIEIGTEELPPRSLRRLGEAFGELLHRALADAALLTDTEADYRWFATPRRLAVRVPGVLRRQPDQMLERRGPALTAAFDASGQPTQAALGFARSCGVEVAALERAQTDKGAWLVYRHRQRGQTAARIVPGCLTEAVKRLPISKRMRWGDLDAEFVRPVHWLAVLHGDDPIRTELLTVRSAPATRGHRFHCPRSLRLTHAERYESTLADRGYVIADFVERRQRIRAAVERLAVRAKGAAVIDEALLDEVTGLVEWPQAILGTFAKEFLEVPPEALVSSMRDHQKYFHVVDRRGRLLPHFITVSNIQSRSSKRVREGNERVLRARLSDARFFWNTDRRQTLESRCPRLRDLMFHHQLGSVADKGERVRMLASHIGGLLGENVALCERAATLAKADLVTEMVGEFPELQGTMGRYYALNDGEDPAVAAAIEEHYRPRFAGDALPSGGIGRAVALADKLDTLVGIFAAGEEPSGDKDPYGLRRAALGTLRILIETGLALDLEDLIQRSAGAYLAEPATRVVIDEQLLRRISDFILDRLHGYYTADGFAADAVAAVAARRPTRPLDFDRRLRAVSRFRKLSAAGNLTAANKRIRNILRKTEEPIPDHVDAALLKDSGEQALAQSVKELYAKVTEKFDRGDYYGGLSALSGLRRPVDRFFDEVMVMADDVAVRRNRLALLSYLQALFLRVADISLLQGTGDGEQEAGGG